MTHSSTFSARSCEPAVAGILAREHEPQRRDRRDADVLKLRQRDADVVIRDQRRGARSAAPSTPWQTSSTQTRSCPARVRRPRATTAAHAARPADPSSSAAWRETRDVKRVQYVSRRSRRVRRSRRARRTRRHEGHEGRTSVIRHERGQAQHPARTVRVCGHWRGGAAGGAEKRQPGDRRRQHAGPGDRQAIHRSGGRADGPDRDHPDCR